MSAHVSPLVACREKKKKVILVIMIMAHARKSVEVRRGFQSSQSRAGVVLRRSYYTVVSIFSMISIMDLEGESREQSS